MANAIDNSEMMQMFRDAIQRSRSAQYQSGAQSAIGAANAIGGVYGHNLQANTAMAGQDLTAKAEEDKNSLGVGQLNAVRDAADLNSRRLSMPAPPAPGVGDNGNSFSSQQLPSGDNGTLPRMKQDTVGPIGSILNKYINSSLKISSDKGSITNLLQ